MSVGQINTLVPNGGNSYSGDLTDLDTGQKYQFQNQDVQNLDVEDVVNFTDKGGTAVDLSISLKIKEKNFGSASSDVQEAAKALFSAMAKDRNMTDINVKKL
jgi:hypothetical protein